jgi:formate hydrogenlyase subunit 3/multisubunit Na+/H+ antiporter MnhD subunit
LAAQTYGAASASVVALFAVMTKVGFYSICRVFAGIFGNDAGALANLATPWIWPLAIATIASEVRVFMPQPLCGRSRRTWSLFLLEHCCLPL